jgi:hypothetical protein
MKAPDENNSKQIPKKKLKQLLEVFENQTTMTYLSLH